jgi:hypothetical protein
MKYVENFFKKFHSESNLSVCFYLNYSILTYKELLFFLINTPKKLKIHLKMV